MKFYLSIATIILAFALGIGTVLALEDGGLVLPVTILNTTGSDATNVQLPFNLSSQTLIDGAFIDSDALDTDVRSGSTSVPYMPGTGRVQMLSCIDESAANETADCNDAGSDDISLPTTGSATFEFAGDNQFKHLWINTSTAVVATGYTCTWSYYNGTSYVTSSNVTDGTACFSAIGLQRVTWDFPAAGQWPTATLHSVNGYWVRVQIASGAVVTTAPLGQQVWYETGRWWTYENSLAADEVKSYETHLDIPATSSATATLTVADDGYCEDNDTSHPPDTGSPTCDNTAASLLVRRSFVLTVYNVDSGIIRFDTSSIPDHARVTAGSLTCTFIGTSQDADGRNLVGEWYSWSTATPARYAARADNDAFSLDLSTASTTGSHTMTLSNLYRVNKGGYTGLRLGIDGGSPSGANTAQIRSIESGSPCTLSLTYDLDRNWHWIIPHVSGMTGSDTAALEPNVDFNLVVTGYIDLTGRANNYLFSKGNDLILRADSSTDGHVQVVQNGSSVIDVTSTSGYHTIEIMQDEANSNDVLTLLIDGTQAATASAAAIANNASPWKWLQNKPGAIEYIYYEEARATRILYQIQDLPDNQLDDQSGNGNDITLRVPDTKSGFTSTVLSAQPTQPQNIAGTIPDNLGAAAVGSTALSTDTDPTTSWWGFTIINIFTGQLVPFRAMIIFVSIGIAWGVAYWFYRKFIRDTLIFVIIGCGLSGVFSIMGGLPFLWAIIWFLAPGLFFMVRKRLPV